MKIDTHEKEKVCIVDFSIKRKKLLKVINKKKIAKPSCL